MRTHPLALAAAAAAAGLILTGCQLPDGGGTGADLFGGTHYPVDTSNGERPRTADDQPIFRNPADAALYRDMTKPLPYSGGDPDSSCGAWEAATPELAAEKRDLQQRCLNGEIDLNGDAP